MTVELILRSLTICTIYAFSSLCAGFVSYKLICLCTRENQEISPISKFASGFLLGLAVLFCIWSLLLSLSIFYTWIVILVLAMCILTGFAYLLQELPFFKSHIKEVYIDFVSESFPWKLVVSLTILLVIQTAIACFLPLKPNSDAAAFYMVLPKLFAETKKLSLLGGYEAFTTIGLHGEFHFAALMLPGLVLPKIVDTLNSQ